MTRDPYYPEYKKPPPEYKVGDTVMYNIGSTIPIGQTRLFQWEMITHDER